MKKCTVCRIEKSEQDFFYRSKRLAKRHSQCKSCYVDKRRKVWKEYYHKHGSKYRQKAVERNRRLKVQTRNLMLEYLKDKRCSHCGINDRRVLEFDHIDASTKSFSIASAITSTYSWNKILDEIEKCQILCANCHKIKTAREGGWYKNSL
jgi:hypothetical protein